MLGEDMSMTLGFKSYIKRWWWFLVAVIAIPSGLLFCSGDVTLEKSYHMYTIWALIYGIISASYDYTISYQRTKNDNKLARSEYFSELYDNEYLRKAREYTREQRSKNASMSADELITLINNDKEFNASIIHTFNFWERIELSIAHDTADEMYLKSFFSDVFIDQFDRFKPWIESTCKNQNKNGYRKLHNLYERWRKKTTSPQSE